MYIGSSLKKDIVEDIVINVVRAGVGAITETDIIIIPQEYATEKLVIPYFANLKSYNLNDVNKCIFNNDFYGIEIYNKNSDNNFLSEMITFNSDDSNHEKYYLFVNKDTVNFNSVVATNSNKDVLFKNDR